MLVACRLQNFTGSSGGVWEVMRRQGCTGRGAHGGVRRVPLGASVALRGEREDFIKGVGGVPGPKAKPFHYMDHCCPPVWQLRTNPNHCHIVCCSLQSLRSPKRWRGALHKALAAAPTSSSSSGDFASMPWWPVLSGGFASMP